MKHFELEESDGWNAFVLDRERVGVQRGVRAGVPLGAELSDGVEGRVDGLPLFDVAFVVGLVVDAASGAQDHWYGELAPLARRLAPASGGPSWRLGWRPPLLGTGKCRWLRWR